MKLQNPDGLGLFLKQLFLYWHTLRYLKVGQIYRRVCFRFFRPRPDERATPNIAIINGTWEVPACRRQSLLDENTFYFLNHSGCLADIGWDGPQLEKLWRYNQHYFDDLNAEGAKDRRIWHRRLLKLWVADNKPGVGSGWEPYPTSLRIVNWVKWQFAGNKMSQDCINSLAVQSRWLSRRIEWHILGNHLFVNAKALVFAGIFFHGEEAEKWRTHGLEIIRRELPEQVLPDGGNFERSPMYHAIFLEDILDLINLSRAYPGSIPDAQVEDLSETAGRMLSFLQGMCHPDGEISMFNDAAMGVATSLTELLNYAGRLGLFPYNKDRQVGEFEYLHYADSGYVRLQTPRASAILDVATVGPDYLPGHAHADTLSFELSLFGKRIIVNGGTSEYGAGATRQKERGTAAHSTVEIDGENSSEVWSGFRVARRAYPVGLQIEACDKEITVSCAHDGYRRLPGRCFHHRLWRLTKGKLLVVDQVSGNFTNAVARFYLHPTIQVVKQDESGFLLEIDGKNITFRVVEGESRIQSGSYSPEFGLRLKTNFIEVHFKSNKGTAVEICWENDY